MSPCLDLAPAATQSSQHGPAATLAVFGWSKTRLGGADWGLPVQLGSGDVRAGARQRAMGDSEAVTVKNSLHLRPEARRSSYPAATQQQQQQTGPPPTHPLVAGTSEVGFLLLFQSLSHPSVRVLLPDLCPARPCSGLKNTETQRLVGRVEEPCGGGEGWCGV